MSYEAGERKFVYLPIYLSLPRCSNGMPFLLLLDLPEETGGEYEQDGGGGGGAFPSSLPQSLGEDLETWNQQEDLEE